MMKLEAGTSGTFRGAPGSELRPAATSQDFCDRSDGFFMTRLPGFVEQGLAVLDAGLSHVPGAGASQHGRAGADPGLVGRRKDRYPDGLRRDHAVRIGSR